MRVPRSPSSARPSGLEARLVPEAGFPFLGAARAGHRPQPALDRGLGGVHDRRARRSRPAGSSRRSGPTSSWAFGAYVSLPVGLAADLTRVPLVIHEQNSVPGLANRVMSWWAERIGVTYPESSNYLHGKDRVDRHGQPGAAGGARAHARLGQGVTRPGRGRPRAARLRRQQGSAAPQRGDRRPLPKAEGFGPGARRSSTSPVARRRRPSASVWPRSPAGEPSGYTVLDYLDDMGAAIAAADLVVARAGATSIAEITALGRAAVLVPYPYATDDHQTRNARGVVEAGAAVLVPDAELDSPAYAEAVLGLLRDEDARDRDGRGEQGTGQAGRDGARRASRHRGGARHGASEAARARRGAGPDADGQGEHVTQARSAHFIGIGGAGMSAVARVFHDQGGERDRLRPEAFAVLASSSRRAGIPVAIGHDAANVGDPDVVVVSSAITRTNPEYAAARRARDRGLAARADARGPRGRPKDARRRRARTARRRRRRCWRSPSTAWASSPRS